MSRRKPFTDKPPPLAWTGEVDGNKGVWDWICEVMFHPIQFIGWVNYRRTYYKRYPARIAGSQLHYPWNDYIDFPRNDGSGLSDRTTRRPEGEKRFRERLKHGYAVFTGKADAVYWLDQ